MPSDCQNRLREVRPFAVIFDWDGVLVDTKALHEKAWQMLAGEIGAELPAGFFARTFGMRNSDVVANFTGWTGKDDTDRIARLALRKESLYRHLVSEEGVQPLPGARELLAELDGMGIPCAIGTSAPRANIEIVLSTLALPCEFAVIMTADDVANGKPHPDVFLCCASGLAMAAGRCVVLEDSPAGIEAARRARMRVIAVASTHAPDTLSAADLVVADLGRIGFSSLGGLIG